MKKLYIKFNENNDFAGFYRDEPENIPNNAIVITIDDRAKYLDALDSGNKNIKLIKNKIKIVDKYTADELAKQQSDRESAALIAQARSLLSKNDYRWNNQLKWQRYDDKTRDAVMKYYDALVAVVNGESDTIPILEIEQ